MAPNLTLLEPANATQSKPTMIALIQRVSEAQVRIEGKSIAAIGKGVLALIGVRRADTELQAQRLAERLLAYRIFPDDSGRMNLSVREAGGELLVVPQFTLAADTASGTRAGFSPAAEPPAARGLFEHLLGSLRLAYAPVSSGVFGADMQVSLINDGPVTFWLEAR
jgi:D-aminoacyl-tRNA deacylase